MHPIYQSNANDTLTSFILEEVTLGLYSMHKILSGQNILAEATYMYFNIIIRSNLVMNDIQSIYLSFLNRSSPCFLPNINSRSRDLCTNCKQQ